MPRARKPQIAPGETYGHRQELEAVAGATPMPQGDELHARAMEGALAMEPPPPGGLLNQPPSPNYPETAGLSTGPGPGPEVLPPMTRRVSQTQALIERAAELTGNPRLRQMSQRVRPHNQGM